MGLSLRLGCAGGDVFFDKRQLAIINERLRAKGLPTHVEPEGMTTGDVQAECRYGEFKNYPSLAFPYGFVHLIRRIYIRTKLDPAFVATPIDDPKEDDEYDGYMCGTDLSLARASHLCWHSDTEGSYLPIDFAEPIFVDKVSVGSTPRLDMELRLVGSKIGLADDAALAAYLVSEYDDSDPFEREKCTLAAMREMCRLSMKFKSALVFS